MTTKFPTRIGMKNVFEKLHKVNEKFECDELVDFTVVHWKQWKRNRWFVLWISYVWDHSAERNGTTVHQMVAHDICIQIITLSADQKKWFIIQMNALFRQLGSAGSFFCHQHSFELLSLIFFVDLMMQNLQPFVN